MQIKKLTISNFRSFAGPHEFLFQDYASGLHFIVGQNQSEPDLGENGTGKSSLFEAVYWVLYGKTTQNLKAGNIHTWNTAGGTSGTVIFSKSDLTYTVTRSWNPNKITVLRHDTHEEEVVTQERLDQIIGITADVFQYTILLGQESSAFFDISPAAKLDLFTDLMNLDYWLYCSDRASAKVDAIAKQSVQIEKAVATLNGRQSQLHEQISAYKQQSENFEVNRTAEIQQYHNTILKMQTGLQEDTANVRQYTKKINTVNAKLDTLEDELRTNLDQYDRHKESIAKHKMKAVEHEKDITAVKREIDKFRAVQDACPYCLQPIDAAHLKRELGALTGRYNTYTKALSDLQAELSLVQSSFTAVDATTSALDTEINGLTRQLDTMVANQTKLNRAIETTEREVQRLEKCIKDKQGQTNPYQELIDQALDAIKQLDGEIQSKQDELERLNTKKASASYWVKAFKELRLFVIERALVTFEVEVNNYLDQLGMHQWRIIFDVEKTTKAGTISKGFQVFIQGPTNAEPVPWEAWSGGERQRLRLAGSLGLADLILARLGQESGVLIVDEPTQHLSGIGVTYLLDTLQTKAEQENKQVWLIDHRSLDFGRFASVTEIIKDDNGSHIVVVNAG